VLFKGAELIVTWLAVTVAISVIAAISYAAFADRSGGDVTADRIENIEKGHNR